MAVFLKRARLRIIEKKWLFINFSFVIRVGVGEKEKCGKRYAFDRFISVVKISRNKTVTAHTYPKFIPRRIRNARRLRYMRSGPAVRFRIIRRWSERVFCDSAGANDLENLFPSPRARNHVSRRACIPVYTHSSLITSCRVSPKYCARPGLSAPQN